MRIYLDNAATTPLDERVIDVMTQTMRDLYGNPSSIHAEGRQGRALIERARKTIAKTLNASIGEIFFTSGGTESNNMALKCAVRDLGVQRIISSPLEHHCVLHTLDRLAKEGVAVDDVRVDDCGRVDYAHLEELLQTDDRQTLVSLMHANNEIGTLLDLDRVANLCTEYGAFLHSDTVQTVGHYPIDVDALKIQFLSGAAHKFHGPKGVGFIYINGEHLVRPFIDGGAQERNMRGGTENVYGIAGMAKALELAYAELSERRAKIETLREHMRTALLARFEGLTVNGTADGLYTVLSVSFPPSANTDMLLLSLDIAGISASGGSACSSGSDTGSHVIQALGQDPARKTIRFSFSHLNTRDEVDRVVAELEKLLPVARSVA